MQLLVLPRSLPFGSSLGNPGRMGFGCLLHDTTGKWIIGAVGYIGTTNNTFAKYNRNLPRLESLHISLAQRGDDYNEAPSAWFILEAKESMTGDSTVCRGEDLPRWSLIALGLREVVDNGQSEAVGQEPDGLPCSDIQLVADNERPDTSVVKSLVYVLKTGTKTSKQNTVCLLLSLAMVEENKSSIGACGAIPPLVSLSMNLLQINLCEAAFFSCEPQCEEAKGLGIAVSDLMNNLNCNIMKIFIVFSITFTCAFLGNFVSNANPFPYEAIFNFGDSISDTGNADKTHPPFPRDSPYGSTYFKHPAGRLSNGRLIIDFIAEAYGLPFLPAYLNLTKDQDIKKGVNFAFAGATALDFEYFIREGVDKPATDNSLSVQIGWFKKFKPSLCKSKEECDNFFKKSLFLVGEIGGNDVMAHISYKDVIGLRELVPPMVEAITNATSALIEEGAMELVVPGNFPIGCISGILTVVNSTKKDEYDQFGCLIAYNTFIEYFNGQLKHAIETLRQKYPQAKIIYFDYYNDAKRLFQAPQQYGFTSDKNEILEACCGAGGTYNVDISIFCGSPGTKVCPDPSKRINWDGAHFTEVAYKQIAKGLVEGPFANPSLKSPPFKIA
ncbi:SGNH hydrolase superfamily [Sesbania bispinosa]|nr:SGNH hydrolase superfamily [Sesbania bispinosa]